MTNLPINANDLNDIVYKVARDFIEKKAINGSLDSVEESTIKEVVDDVSFVIDSYMSYFNELIENERIKQISDSLN